MMSTKNQAIDILETGNEEDIEELCYRITDEGIFNETTGLTYSLGVVTPENIDIIYSL